MTRMVVARIVREKRMFMLPLLVALVANVAIAALVVYPMTIGVAQAEQEEAIARQGLRAAEVEFAAVKATLADKSRAEQDLKRFYAEILPTGLVGARRATYVLLAQLARDADLTYQRRLEDTRPPRPGELGGSATLTQFEISMVLQGEYESVRQFLRDIEAAKAFIIIDNVALSQGTEPGAALALTVVLSTYYRTAGHGL